MKKYKYHISVAIIIFLYTNSSMYWLHTLGAWIWCVLCIYLVFFVIGIALTIHSIVICLRHALKDRASNVIAILMIVVLFLAIFLPQGIISKKMLYGGTPLVTYLDGVAGNNGWLTLYGNKTYEYSYGSFFLNGHYKVKGDTVFFSSSDRPKEYSFDYATLSEDKSDLCFGKDSITYFHMTVVKNELFD